MKMTIISFEYSNIRKFSDIKVLFTDSTGKLYKNNFIMMGNGTGKTTTITLIKGLLDGSADAWSPEFVRSFAPASRSDCNGKFEIKVKFDEKTYIYILNLNYVSGKADIQCTTSAQGGLGPRTFPSALKGLFTEEFVRRFVFDGEQATKAMDNNSNEAEEAIKYLYRLDVFDEISRANRQILSDIQMAGGGKGTSQSVQNLRTRQSKVKAAVDRLSQRQRELHSLISEKRAAKENLESRIDKLDKKYTQLNVEKEDAIKRLDGFGNDINLCISQILSNIKAPYLLSESICSRMYELGDCMTKLKLPKTISSDFFKELAQEPECICGRNIGSAEKAAILSSSERFLGSDQQSVLNNIKSTLMNSVYDDRLLKNFSHLDTLVDSMKIAEDNLLDMEDRLAKAGGEEAAILRKDRDNLISHIGQLEEKLSVIESKDDSNPFMTEENNLYKAKNTCKELEGKIASATETNAALHRTEVIEDLIKQIKLETTKRLKQEIINKTNDKLRKVITDDLIEIETINQYIQLRGKSGASEGQTLSIAYCFLGTMFEDSELQFPFVIDSPAGKMDYEKRRAVANILPTLFNQLIAFVTSAEVEKFADQFYDDANSQFTTVISHPMKNAVEVHLGKEYFDSYQREHKEDAD